MQDVEEYLIDCIAVDGELHVCYPWSDTTHCEEKLKVVDKKVKPNQRVGRFSCYECTY